MVSLTAVTDETFTTEVLDSEIPVIVDFWAPWCGPCRALSPVLEQLAAEYQGRIKVVGVNVDENPESVTRFAVVTVPSVLGFSAGHVVRQVKGAQPKKVLQEEFADLLS